jgi:hypothetical protein
MENIADIDMGDNIGVIMFCITKAGEACDSALQPEIEQAVIVLCDALALHFEHGDCSYRICRAIHRLRGACITCAVLTEARTILTLLTIMSTHNPACGCHDSCSSITELS